jgi:tRNA A-37 threonylcarbamoyl transferase component Bud32
LGSPIRKLGRSVLYGSLEDEAPFETVCRLVQYEDYLLRLMRDAGLPTPTPYGVVVLTPEREYLVVCEFFDGAVELGDAQIDGAVIDDALSIVRRLWDAGLAHRDVKPSNLLQHDGRVRLIDVAFAEVRLSPWRRAVDLANMMLVLGLRPNAQRVYRRALRQFRPEEIEEAFAASRGVTIPSQSRDVVVSSNTATGTMREVPSDQAGARKYQGPPAVTVRAGTEGTTAAETAGLRPDRARRCPPRPGRRVR